MGLLAADLRAIANLPREAIGRRLLFHAAVGLGLVAFMSWWIGNGIVSNPNLLRLLEERGGDSLHRLLGMALLPCPVAATWLGLSLAQRQLFETAELDLWQTAPVPPWRGALQVLLRACFQTLIWATALTLPFVLTLLASRNAPPAAYAMVPLAILAATLPLLAILLAVQVVMVRFFAGRKLRLLLSLIAAAASIGFLTWLLLVLFTGSERKDQFVTGALAPDSLPWTVDVGAALLRSAAHGVVDTASLRATGAWLALAAAVFWFASRLHPRALEAHRLAEPPLRRRRASWPTGLASVIRRKELAQVLQQPGALIGFLIFAFLVFALVEKQVMVGSILGNWRLPSELRHTAAMLLQWFLAVVLVLYPHMGRLVLWDSAQWSLYMTTPAAPITILCGKLTAVGLLLLWPMLLVAAVGTHALGASPRSLLLFLAIAGPGTLVALGVLATVGTLPWLMRPDDGGQMAQGGRNFFASMLLILGFEFAVAPGGLGWWWLASWAQHNALTVELVQHWTPPVVGTAWLIGLLALGLGMLLGARNYRKLTKPR